MPEFDPSCDEVEEALPNGLRPTPPCPPLPLLLAHQEGVLPEEAASSISSHLQHCGLCRTLLADLEHLPQPGLSEHERDRLRGKLPLPSPPSSGKWRWYASGAAVAAVLLVGAFFTLRPAPVPPAPATQATQATPPQAPAPIQKPEQPRLQVAKLDPPLELASELVLRGSAPGDRPTASELLPAFKAYGANQYPLAVERFSLLAKRYPRADVPLLYLGVAQLMVQDDHAALASLARADQFAAKTRKDAASWYHAVAAVQTQSPEASALLHDLCHRNKSHYAQQACALEKTR